MERGMCSLELTTVGDEQMVVAMAILYLKRFNEKLKF